MLASPMLYHWPQLNGNCVSYIHPNPFALLLALSGLIRRSKCMRMQACFQALRKMFQAGTKPDHAARSDVTPIQPQPPPSAALHEFLEALGEDALLILVVDSTFSR